jgi:hypothetical protein
MFALLLKSHLHYVNIENKIFFVQFRLRYILESVAYIVVTACVIIILLCIGIYCIVEVQRDWYVEYIDEATVLVQ